MKKISGLLSVLISNLQQTPAASILILVWLATMLGLPFAIRLLGKEWLIRGITVNVLMQALAVSLALFSRQRWVQALKTQALVLILAYFAELVGSQTGFPFGEYHYTTLLQPQVAGVPILIPLAWLMMLPPAWAIAWLILPHTQSRLLYALLSGLVFTAWDLFLDPQMVGWGLWAWETPGVYFGIPLVNYFGWLIVSVLITLIVSPTDLPLAPLAVIYTLTWLLQAFGQAVFWSQPGPAFFGFVGCGVFVWLAWRNIPTALHL